MNIAQKMIYHQDSQLTIHNADALTALKAMPAESAQMCVTSPPYYGLRDYGTGQWEGGNVDCDHIKPITNYNKGFNERYSNDDGTAAQKQEVKSAGQYSGTCKKCGAVRTDQQIGMEETPELFIAKLVDVFREVRRVMKDDGTCWINIGDSYWGGKGQSGSGGKEFQQMRVETGVSFSSPAAHVGGNGKTRPTDKKHESIKAKDLIGIPWMLAFALRADGWYLRSEIIWHKLNPMPESVTDRPTKAHEQIFLLSKSAKYFYDADAVREPWADDRKGSSATVSLRYSEESGRNGDSGLGKQPPFDGRNRRSVWSIASAPYSDAHFATFPPALIEPCILAGSRIGDVVLDPFGGSGTTAEVANKFGRKAVLIELNPDYCELAMKRNCQKTLFAGAEV